MERARKSGSPKSSNEEGDDSSQHLGRQVHREIQDRCLLPLLPLDGMFMYISMQVSMLKALIRIRTYAIPLIRTIPSTTWDQYTRVLVEDWAE